MTPGAVHDLHIQVKLVKGKQMFTNLSSRSSHSSRFFPSVSYTSAHPMSIIYQQVWIIQNLAKVQLLRPGFNKSDDDPHMCHEKNLRHAMQSLSPMARSVQTSKGAHRHRQVVYPKEISFPFTSISKEQVKRLQSLRSRWWKKANPHLKLGVVSIWNLIILGCISESSPRLKCGPNIS